MRHAVSTGLVFARRYRLVRRISVGGMAEVYEVEHLGTRRRLALKVLLPEVMADEPSVERFRREASVCANVDSAHVVEVIDCDVDATSHMPFLVMELLSGKDLAQYIAETWGAGVPIAPSLVLTVLRQAASALDKVHAEGIVHRDLKPANLFLTFPSDGPPHVKILDFGIAKLVHEKRSSNASRLGTPLYMSPEQLTGRDEVTAATDVWALALIAHELLTGVAYWEGNTAASLLDRIPDAAQHPRPSTLAAARGVSLSPAFDRWLLRCIDPDPSKRPATAGEAVGELLRVFDPQATQPPARAAEAAPPTSIDLRDTQRDQRDQRAVAVSMAPRAAPPRASLPRAPLRASLAPGAPPRRPAAPDPAAPDPAAPDPAAPDPAVPGPAAKAVPPPPKASPEIEALEALEVLDVTPTPVRDSSERPTIRVNHALESRVQPVAPRDAAEGAERPTIPVTGRKVMSRIRDGSEARTIKMATVGARKPPSERPPRSATPPAPEPAARPHKPEAPSFFGGKPSEPALEGPRITALAIPLVTQHSVSQNAASQNAVSQNAVSQNAVSQNAVSQEPRKTTPQSVAQPQPRQSTPAHPAPAPVALPKAEAPDGPPIPPPRSAPKTPSPADLLAQRIQQAAVESEATPGSLPQHAPSHALTMMLPVIPPMAPQGVRPGLVAAAAVAALLLASAAGYVLLRGRQSASTAPRASVPAWLSPAAQDRAALLALERHWSTALLARQNTDGGFGEAAGSATSGLDTARGFVALLRGHVTGAPVPPSRQLAALAALDGARLADGWSPSAGAPRRATVTATAWATLAYALMTEENHAETGKARVRVARELLVRAQQPDGAFADAAGGAASDEATVTATWALIEAERADPGAAPSGPRERAVAWVYGQLSMGTMAPVLSEMAFWVIARAHATGTAPPDAALTGAYARALLARCAPSRGCDAPGAWEPWTALSTSALVHARTLDAGARRDATALLQATLARFAASRDGAAASGTAALTSWLFAAAELQR